MSVESDLRDFYDRHGFGPELGARPKTVKVYTGCLLVPMPNIEARRKYLKYHDLHHLVTGFGVGRIGEANVSAWELGTGSFLASPLLGAMNLIALSTGLFLRPRQMARSFAWGSSCSNLYGPKARAAVDSGAWGSVSDIRGGIATAGSGSPPLWRWGEFGLYCAAALAIHAAVALPAMALRIAADQALGMTLFESLAPKTRSDLH